MKGKKSSNWETTSPMLLAQHNFWKRQALHFLCHPITVNCWQKSGHKLPQKKTSILLEIPCSDFSCLMTVFIFAVLSTRAPGYSQEENHHRHTGSALFNVCTRIKTCLFGIIKRASACTVQAGTATVKQRDRERELRPLLLENKRRGVKKVCLIPSVGQQNRSKHGEIR